MPRSAAARRQPVGQAGREVGLPPARGARYDPEVPAAAAPLLPRANGFVMEIVSLKAWVSEDDLNGVAARSLDGEESVRDLKLRVLPEGVRVSGAYRVAFFNVRFDTLWSLSLQGGEVAARLADLNVAGAPAGMVRGTLLEMLAANLARDEGARVEGESIVVNPDALLARFGIAARTNLRAVRCEAGRIVIEAGAP